MSYSDLLHADWSRLPGDVIDSIAPYLSAQQVLDLCIHNDTFNRRVCQNQDSIVWKLLYRRDISHNVPRDHIASHYLDIMDNLLTLDPQRRLFYGAKHGYEEMVKSALQQGADIHGDIHGDNRGDNDYALILAAKNGHPEIVKLLLDRGARIHASYDFALRRAAENGHTETVKLLLDRGAKIHALGDDALEWAVYEGHPETVKLLLAYGATITAEIRRMAEDIGNPQILALLE